MSEDILREVFAFFTRRELIEVSSICSNYYRIVHRNFPYQPYHIWSWLMYRFYPDTYRHHLRIAPQSDDSRPISHIAMLTRSSNKEYWAAKRRRHNEADEELLAMLNSTKPFRLPGFIRFCDVVVDAVFSEIIFHHRRRRRYFAEYLSRFMDNILQAEGVSFLCRYNNAITNRNREQWNLTDTVEWVPLCSMRSVLLESQNFTKTIIDEIDSNADASFFDIIPLQRFRNQRYVSIVMEDPPMGMILDFFFMSGKRCTRISVHNVGLEEYKVNVFYEHCDKIYDIISERFMKLKVPLEPVTLLINIFSDKDEFERVEPDKSVRNETIKQTLRYDKFASRAQYRTWK